MNVNFAARARRAPALSLLLLLAAGILACERPQGEARWAVGHRLIVEPTDEVFDLEAMRRSYGYQRRSFERPDQLRRWRTHDAAEITIKNGLLQVRPSGEGHGFIRVSHEIEFFAEDVREIVIEARGIRQGHLQLLWAIPGEGFANARRLRLKGKRKSRGGAAPSAFVTYRFEVAGHPAWRGRIRALRLDLPNIAGQDVEIRAVETRGREGYEAEMLARIVAQDWKVEVDYEARNAVLTPPDVPRHWQLPEPAAGKLRFAYSLPRGVGAVVSFRIRGLRAGGDASVLFEDTVDPRDGTRTGRWFEGTLDLDRKIRELVFETTAPPGYRIKAGLPAWGNPEILSLTHDERRPNVVLISVDTLRADRLGVYGYDEPTSPNIDRWARSRAVTFRRAVTTAPWTLPSHVSMLSGLDALSHGVNHHLAAPRELELLGEVLRRAGYLTAAVTGGGWLHPDQGLAQGFDVFRYWGHGTAGENELESGIERALELLEVGRERELFLFFHTYEAHDPFRHRLPWAERCPESPGDDPGVLYGAVEEERMKDDGFPLRYGFRKWRAGSPIKGGEPLTEAELPLVSCLYDSGIAYVDQHLGRLFERLETLDPDRQTLVLLTSDHGESLGEYGYVKHAYLLDSNLLVPLIVSLPGAGHGGKTVDAQVSTVDIVPTILAALGLEAPAGLDGTSLLPLIDGKGAEGPRQAWSYAGSSNFGLSLRVDNRAKYVYNNTAWAPLGGAEELFDLRTDADERDNHAPASPQRTERLRAVAREYLEARSQGVRVEIEHRGCGTFTGELVGLPVHISRVKTARPPGERFEWLAKRRGVFRLQPGETLDLLLEAARGTVTVEGEIQPCDGGEGVPLKHPIDLDRLETWELGFDGTAWREDLENVDASTRIVLRREGRRVSEPDRSEMDPALVEQLKALGYLND